MSGRLPMIRPKSLQPNGAGGADPGFPLFMDAAVSWAARLRGAGRILP